jgi:DNA-binding transcriptional regulator YhcF (GntR family)
MHLRDLNTSGKTKINKINSLLKEHFGMSVAVGSFPKKEKLTTVKEMTEKAIIKLKDTNKHFQLEPEYAKYLGIKDVIDTMLSEGMYAESPAYESMCSSLRETIKELMDSGYTMDEASKECMNRFRKDSRYAYDDEHVLPIVLTAAKEYYEASCNSKHESLEEIAIDGPQTDLNQKLLSELAKECGVELEDVTSLEAIEEKINMFAEVSGKSRDAVVGFLNGLEEDTVANGIQMFGKKVAEQNKFTGARKDAIAQGKDEFEVDGETYKVTGDTSDEKKQAKKESMFDDIINDMLSEEVESVEEAEVVMAVRALADDIQDHVERLGRMVNEDLPAIADQMINEFGADKASQFKDSAESVLSQALEASKQAKDGVNQIVGNITGQPTDLGLGDTSDLGSDDVSLDDLASEPEMDVNEPAASGPEDEPLGRAPIEV